MHFFIWLTQRSSYLTKKLRFVIRAVTKAPSYAKSQVPSLLLTRCQYSKNPQLQTARRDYWRLIKLEASFLGLSRDYLRIFVERLKKNTKHFVQNVRCSGQDSELGTYWEVHTVTATRTHVLEELYLVRNFVSRHYYVQFSGWKYVAGDGNILYQKL